MSSANNEDLSIYKDETLDASDKLVTRAKSFRDKAMGGGMEATIRAALWGSFGFVSSLYAGGLTVNFQ